MPKQKSISSSQIANQWNEDKIALNHLTLFRGNVISKKKIYCQIKFLQTDYVAQCLYIIGSQLPSYFRPKDTFYILILLVQTWKLHTLCTECMEHISPWLWENNLICYKTFKLYIYMISTHHLTSYGFYSLKSQWMGW